MRRGANGAEWVVRGVALAAMLASAGCSDADRSAGCPVAVIDTTSGELCGTRLELPPSASVPEGAEVLAYRGIPYAEPPLEDRRFMPPVPVARSATVIDASAFGPVCPQSGPVPAFFTPVDGIAEDCLTLNVWRPERPGASTPLPVMLWIHGGEYIRHGSGQNGWDGRILAARENVVVVSINYRLGALSFLYDAADGIRGNLGMMDQQLAMRWVRDNVAAFGGDPDRVTLFGWSAGAVSVALQALSIPSSREPTPLFRAILTQSSVLGLALQDTGTEAGRTFLAAQANAFRQAVCPGSAAGAALDCLQAAPVSVILEAQSRIASAGQAFFPIVDRAFLVRQPLAGALEGKLDLPAIIGTNLDEGNLFAAQFLGSSYLTGLSPSGYAAQLSALFTPEQVTAILAQPAYAATENNVTQFQSVLTDYQFGCVNRRLGRAATGPIFMYVFEELPNVNVNWDQQTDPDCMGQTCIACMDAVCHGDEHPFMWNSLPIVDGTPPIPDPLLPLLDARQQELANVMQDFWGNFARNLDPGTAAGHRWPSFAGAGTYQILGCQGEGCEPILSTTTTVPYQECDFWDTQIGYEGLPPG